DLEHIADLFERSGNDLACLFGPQHGYAGDTQANMIEWEGYLHPRLGIPVHSLYGAVRRPTPEMLAGLDTVLIDLPDTGARPYTYIWTSLLMMRECARAGIRVVVADRPDPINGTAVEGEILREDHQSFVGMFPMTMRHGMTLGEALVMFDSREEISCELEIVRLAGWKRERWFDETGLPWVLPSPNMPTPDTAIVYPGMVLLEATNISEGRGTTRPFEICGAPWIDAEEFARRLGAAHRRHGLEGAVFRPLGFRPAWDKYAGELCGGIQIHVTARDRFRPVRCAALLIDTAARMYPEHFRFLPPPYEYEETLMPADILSGSPLLRQAVEKGAGLEAVFDRWAADEASFGQARHDFLLYR
ncbi:MAG TPA: DUF1343 domain-containing protein, partial [Candidatus Krumholzibacterium sp.]|nr:DUF1343 domain-containing protein [Candidatus Krumholzibacterium sp.]